jgi:DNA (cytosine-5)-methyltransferase 1
VRKDLDIEPSHPKPVSKPIPAKYIIAGCLGTRSQTINPWIPAAAAAATICKSDYSYQALILSNDDLEEAKIKESWQMSRVLKGLEKHKHFGLVRLRADRISPMIVKDCGNTSTGMVHPYEIRKLTIPEIKRIASFPDDFKLIGKFKDKWARIGNSVPPNLMRAIAEHIKVNILGRIE